MIDEDVYLVVLFCLCYRFCKDLMVIIDEGFRVIDVFLFVFGYETD